MKPRVYVETSVIRYLAARPSADAINATRPLVGDSYLHLHTPGLVQQPDQIAAARDLSSFVSQRCATSALVEAAVGQVGYNPDCRC